MPLKLAALVPVVFAFGFILEEQKLEDRTTPFSIDHAMDARLDAYVPLVAAGDAPDLRSDRELFALAGRWREGRRAMRLLPPMPARYGDGDGARRELVIEAIRLSSEIALRARHRTSPVEALAIYRLALEPLSTVQYADVETLGRIESRRRHYRLAMADAGFDRTTIEETLRGLTPDPQRVDELLRHMGRLRKQFRVRFEDDASLWSADPFYEALLQGGKRGRILARR